MQTELIPPLKETDPDPTQPLKQPSRFGYLPLVVLALLIMNLLATCNNIRTSQLAVKNQPYIYVQNPDGTIIEAEPVDALKRSEAVVAKFAEDWLQLAFTWKEKAAKPDQAYVKERGIDFPNPFHAASLAIKPGYREAYMDATAEKYQKEFPLSNYISGQHQSYVRIYDQPKVKQLEEGLWDVAIVATRIHGSGNSILTHEVFNRVLRVRAIKPSNQKLWGKKESHLGQLLNEMQHQGLQIVEINEF